MQNSFLFFCAERPVHVKSWNVLHIILETGVEIKALQTEIEFNTPNFPIPWL